MKITKSYKYRLKPNKTQQILMNKTFGCVRLYWNYLVETFNSYKGEKLTYKTSKEFKKEYDFIKEVSAASLQQKQRDFNEFKRQYFNKKRKTKINRPSFKSKRNKQSYRLPNQKFDLKNGKIRLEKIGWVRYDFHREIPDNAKLLSVTITKNTINQYFISINFSYEKQVQNKIHLPNIGIDLGLKQLAVLSDGVSLGNPKYLRENQARLRIAQKHLSRKVKGSNRWNKQRVKVAKLHNKVNNKRDWHLHNVSKWIVDNYNEIGMEDLRVNNMLKNSGLSKSISDTSMRKLRLFIDYKQKECGKQVEYLDTFETSTKECNVCGHKQELKLSDRVFICKNCLNKEDRDKNAAIVIRNKTVGVNAVKQTQRDCKTNLHPVVKIAVLNEASKL